MNEKGETCASPFFENDINLLMLMVVLHRC